MGYCNAVLEQLISSVIVFHSAIIFDYDFDFSNKSEEMRQFFKIGEYFVLVVNIGPHHAQELYRQSTL